MNFEKLYDELEELREQKEILEDKGLSLREIDSGRLRSLEALNKQIDLSDRKNWKRNIIPERDFKSYAKELAGALGYLSDSSNNPLLDHIDWESWAESLKPDYSYFILGDRGYWYEEED